MLGVIVNSSTPSTRPGSESEIADARPVRQAVFATTRWSVVVTAGHADTTRAHAALEDLCGAYWYPLYAFVRRQGHNAHDAEDLTQAFFAQLLEKNWIASADRERGRFRSFLLISLKHFLANEWNRAQAQKRGGRIRIVPLKAGDAESRYQREPSDTATPDKAFDRQWALALLDRVLAALREELAAQGKERQFNLLKSCLAGSRESQPYARLAVELGTTEGAVKVTVHRMRQRYRELLRAEIAETVADPAEVDEEMRALFAALAG
jgi:RNA polymerase sigma-70 factor (ECF subfamily)